MSSFKHSLFFILLIILQSENGYSLLDQSEIPTTSSNSKKYKYTYSESDIQTDKILYIKAVPTTFSSPGYLYASFDENVSEDKRLFSSQDLGTNELYINLGESQYAGKTDLYLLMKASNPSSITLTHNLIEKIELSDTQTKAKFKFPSITNVYYKVPNSITYSSIFLYSVGDEWSQFNMEVNYKTSNDAIRSLNVKQIVETGFGVIVDLNKIGSGKDINIVLTSNLKDNLETKIEVGFEIADQETTYKRPINILEHVYGATEYSENCYNFVESLDLNKHPVLFINALTYIISFVAYDSTGEKLYSQDVFHNSYIRFFKPYNNINNMNYFCIKKYTPKDKDYEILGQSSYNFQLYYEEELSNDQMHNLPLSIGRIYTHTLNSQGIMVYRHKMYDIHPDNSIFSTNLVRIRGNPKLYGYLCETYPDCTIAKNTPNLEEIEKINLYYVNKRRDVPGNKYEEINGEFGEEMRKQYMSVVICDTESTDPNNGECKYTIEVHNENNDVELLPENIYATTFYPGVNYFDVRIPNYEDHQKLNISFTVLTGNCYMEIFHDYYSTKKMTEYKYHKVFRREIFEFTSGDIKERYWGTAHCSEASFIELTYVTDFDYKGYLMTNAGEVNIECINRNSSLFPYEIRNPYYYHPLNTNVNKNKDFFFKIRTTECSMLYNYNYQNMPNTNTVDMTFDRREPYFYLTSFAFMSTVDNYNFNTNDNFTDCSMIVYSGEIDSEEKPVLIIADYPIFSDFEKTNFIYPFLNDENFQGIMVDIKFINNNGGEISYKVNLIVNKNIIIQNDISKDETIFLDPTKSTINCGNNLQCTLKIQIYKNSDSDKNYNFTVNVHSPKSEYPEIIDQTQSSNKILISKGATKTITANIGKNEETQFKLDISSGKETVKAKLIPKNQISDNNIYIFNDDSSSMLSYNSNTKLLIITKSDSQKCDGGCELVIQVQVDNTNEEFTEVTITQGPLTQSNENKDDDDDNKIEAWLCAVIAIICSVVVACALIIVYFLVLKKKSVVESSVTSNIIPFKNIGNSNLNNENNEN